MLKIKDTARSPHLARRSTTPSTALRKWPVSIIILVLAVPWTSGLAQEDKALVDRRALEAQMQPKVPSQVEDDGIEGLLVDNTVTFIGRTFYENFAIAWLDELELLGRRPGEHGNFSIHERPTARTGSQIWIEYDRQRLFQVFLSPVRARIQATARGAAAVVARRFETLELQDLLFGNPDLAPDEF